MKKFVFIILMTGCMGNSFAASIEQYVNAVHKIRESYAQDLRGFLRSLDPQLTQFSPEQQLNIVVLTSVTFRICQVQLNKTVHHYHHNMQV